MFNNEPCWSVCGNEAVREARRRARRRKPKPSAGASAARSGTRGVGALGSAESAPSPEPGHNQGASNGELHRLQAALEEERQTRARLESRIQDLEHRLHEAQRQSRATGTESARQEVAQLGLQAELAADTEEQARREALETWLMEAELHAIQPQETVAPAPAGSAMPELPPEGAAPEYSEKLNAAQVAIDAAEARASHNAKQVKKLTEELAAARAEQMRTASRLQALNERVRHAEARAELLDRYGGKDLGATEFSEAELTPQSAADASPLAERSLEDTALEPPAPPEIAAEEGEPESEAPAIPGADDAFAEALEAWGRGDLEALEEDSAEAEEPPAGTPHVEAPAEGLTGADEEEVGLEDALISWSAEEEFRPGVHEEDSASEETGAIIGETEADEEEGGTLGRAEEEFSGGPQKEESAFEQTVAAVGGIEAEEEEAGAEDAAGPPEETLEPVALEPRQEPEEWVSEIPEPEEQEEPLSDFTPEPSVEVEEVRAEEAIEEDFGIEHGDPQEAPSVLEVEQALETPEAPERFAADAERSDVAEALEAWSGMAGEERTRRPPEPTPEERARERQEARRARPDARKGKRAMVDALMRFMGED